MIADDFKYKIKNYSSVLLCCILKKLSALICVICGRIFSVFSVVNKNKFVVLIEILLLDLPLAKKIKK
jgi:hypothetical protein